MEMFREPFCDAMLDNAKFVCVFLNLKHVSLRFHNAKCYLFSIYSETQLHTMSFSVCVVVVVVCLFVVVFCVVIISVFL